MNIILMAVYLGVGGLLFLIGGDEPPGWLHLIIVVWILLPVVVIAALILFSVFGPFFADIFGKSETSVSDDMFVCPRCQEKYPGLLDICPACEHPTPPEVVKKAREVEKEARRRCGEEAPAGLKERPACGHRFRTEASGTGTNKQPSNDMDLNADRVQESRNLVRAGNFQEARERLMLLVPEKPPASEHEANAIIPLLYDLARASAACGLEEGNKSPRLDQADILARLVVPSWSAFWLAKVNTEEEQAWFPVVRGVLGSFLTANLHLHLAVKAYRTADYDMPLRYLVAGYKEISPMLDGSCELYIQQGGGSNVDDGSGSIWCSPVVRNGPFAFDIYSKNYSYHPYRVSFTDERTIVDVPREREQATREGLTCCYFCQETLDERSEDHWALTLKEQQQVGVILHPDCLFIPFNMAG